MIITVVVVVIIIIIIVIILFENKLMRFAESHYLPQNVDDSLIPD